MPRPLSLRAPGRKPARPGAMLKKLRIQRGWTLKEVSQRTGYPVSTLSKIENDRVSLTYDKLTRISAGLEVDFSRLFGAHEPEHSGGSGRRSVDRAGEGKLIESRNYTHIYPAAELLNKRLIPIIVDVRARNLEEFGELIRHEGEEYVYVIEGQIDVHTSLYAPLRLKAGDSVYLDSTMGHGYVAASDGPCRILAVCSGLESQMVAAVRGEEVEPTDARESASSSQRRRRLRRTA